MGLGWAPAGREGMIGGGREDEMVGDLSLAGGAKRAGGSGAVDELSEEMVSSEVVVV